MYFVNPLMFEFEPVKIANVTQSGDVAKDLARFIAIYEKQCLEELLGSCLAKELLDSFELTTVDNIKAYRLKDDATVPIQRLVNGYTYTPKEQDGDEIASFWSVYGAIFGFNYGFGCGCGCGGSECTERVWKGFVQTTPLLIGQSETTESRSFITDYIYYHYLYVNRSITAGSGQQVLTGENSTTVSSLSKRVDRYNEFIFSVLGRKGQTSLYRFLHDNKSDYPTWQPNCNLRFKDKY